MWRQSDILVCSLKRNIRKIHLCANSPRTVRMEIREIGKLPEPESKLETVTTQNYLQKPKEMSPQYLHFDDIPGPLSLKILSKVWGVFPMLGTEASAQVIRYFLQRDSVKESGKLFFKKVFDQYGPIVKLNGIFGSDIILLCRPEHACIALNCTKSFYVRSFFDSVETYRQDWRKYQKSGPFLKFDDDWKTIKGSFDEKDITLNTDYSAIDNFSELFTKGIIENRNHHGEPSNGLKIELYKWSLECLSTILFKTEMGFLNQQLITPTSESGRLLDGLIGATDALRKLEYGFHFWRFGDTPTFQSLVKNCDLIDGVLCKYIQKAMKALREKKEKKSPFKDVCLVESLLMNNDLSEEDIMTILLDTIIISGNAASHIVALLLFHFAKNPRSQIKLLEEIASTDENVKLDNINKRQYLNACIKECLRLDPPIPIVCRQLENDMILSHYRIPKDTQIFYSTYLNSNREEYFEDASRFKPERWLPGDLGDYGQEYQTFASNCLGFGPDAKTIRDVLHMQIAKLIVKIVTKFRIEYNFGELRYNTEFMAPSNKYIRLRFINRNK